MSTPYEQTFKLGALSAGDIVQIGFPSRIALTKVNCVGPPVISSSEDESVSESESESVTEYNLDVYNRAFGWAAVKALAFIENSGLTTCCLTFASAMHELQVGDSILVAGSPVGAYNTVHVVTSIVDPYRVITDQTWTANAAGGTAVLAIPEAQHALYEVIPQQAAVSGIVRWAGNVPFFNHDPPSHLGNQRFIYVKVSESGSYRLTLGGFSDID